MITSIIFLINKLMEMLIFALSLKKEKKVITSTDQEIVCYETLDWNELWKYEEKISLFLDSIKA